MCLRRWILPIVVFVSFSRLSFAQTNDWAVVTHLLPGLKVKLVTTDGRSHVGNVRSVTEDGIQIGKAQLIPKQHVRQVLLMSPNHRGRNALIGLGIGGGLGFASSMTCTGEGFDWGKSACAATFIPFMGAVGAGIGALVPSHSKWQEVYRSN